MNIYKVRHLLYNIKNSFSCRQLKDIHSLANQIDKVSEEEIERVVQDINIPYFYLDINVRRRLRKIVEVLIKPNLQNALRSGTSPAFFSQEIKKLSRLVSPQKLSLKDFIKDLEDIYATKIYSQKLIADFLKENFSRQKSTLSDVQRVNQGLQLYNLFLKIDPLYFVYTSKIKKFIEYYYQKIAQNNKLDRADFLFLLTPSQPSFFQKKEVDFAQYRISRARKRLILETKLIRLYFNGDRSLLRQYIETKNNFFDKNFFCYSKRAKMLSRYIAATRKKIFQFRREKNNWLDKYANRFPGSRDINKLLVFDHSLDKFLESQLCFLHDLFLKIYLLQHFRIFREVVLNNRNCQNYIERAIKFDDSAFTNNLLHL